MWNKISEKLTDARFWKHVHLVMVGVWILLLIPSILFWSQSILWLVFMSVYACTAGHFSSWQAARAEVMEQEAIDERK